MILNGCGLVKRERKGDFRKFFDSFFKNEKSLG